VSLKKERINQEGINLDMAVVSNRLIATGFPASGIEGTYRNNREDFITLMLNSFDEPVDAIKEQIIHDMDT
jgi:hypothetical protein